MRERWRVHAVRMTGQEPGTGRRLTGWRARIVWSIAALVAVIMIGGTIVAASVGAPQPINEWLSVIVIVGLVIVCGTVGSLLATRLPGNPIGWLLWLIAILWTIAIGGGLYADISTASYGGTLPGTSLMPLLTSLAAMPAIVLPVVFIPLYFPDGALPSPRWRAIPWLAAAGIVLLFARDSGFGAGVGPVLEVATIVFIATCIPTAVLAVVVRYRRGDSTERQQLKWFVGASAIAAVGLGAAILVPEPYSQAGWLLCLTGLALLPIAIGIAVLRYRLYEIDRIISRTLAYAILTAALAAVFVAVVLGLQGMLSRFIAGNTIAVAASTLVVAALFQPLRGRIKEAMDRRFNRARYDARRTSDRFAEVLRDDVDMGSIRDDLLTVVRDSLQPTTIGVWMREGMIRHG
jgi:hypothetical protein